MKDSNYKNNLTYWKEMSSLWKAEHDAVLKEVASIVRRISRDNKEYGQVQKETLKRLAKLARK
jgi:vacuolar-type H+-ATPase subunit D/Vma8